MALLSITFGWPVWLAILATFAICLSLGALNGYLVIRTGLPSFIVTLAFLFILRGLTIWLAVTTTNQTIISGIEEAAQGDPLAWLFGGKILTGFFAWMGEQGWIETFARGNRAGQPVVDGIPMVIVWAIALLVAGHWLLTRTKFGNWIYAAGGDAQAARYVGVPVRQVKILMFVGTAFVATVLAMSQVVEFGSAAADRGLLKEFEAIICVVIGGALLTGGYGSVSGAALGAIIFGVVQQGLYFANVEGSLFRVFLGTILLVAVITNTYIRRLITGER
jgi:simple sugar transport system permease protein